MPKGISLHIGLNSVDPKCYGGWAGTLAACEFDANDMQKIAAKKSFISKVLLTKKATRAAVTGAIKDAAKNLRTGDIFFLTYSGHGGQVPDTNGDQEEDGKDETWVLYDSELVDDELYALWSEFETGVRILVLSDSCHSGTVAREVSRLADAGALSELLPKSKSPPRPKAMPEKVQDLVNRKHKKRHDKIQKEFPAGERVAVGASVLLISGCQDNQTSLDGDRNGAFTGAMLEVWNKGAFKKGYRAFHKEIQRKLPFTQSPNYFRTGSTNVAFERQSPFTV
jgi:metacaspase-1